jgi:hypothetical protein
MNRYIAVVIMLFLVSAMPAYAYGDPSGGTLFQILMPALAGLWAMWMILANRIRKLLAIFYRRLRGMEREEPTL